MGLTIPTSKLSTQTVSASFDQLLYLDAADGMEEATLKIVSAELGHSALQIAAEKVLVKSTDTNQALAFNVQNAAGANVLQVDGSSLAVTLGVDDTGADFRVYSATASEGLFYDASQDEFGLLLTTKLKFHDIGGGEEIYASANGHLEINAGTTLDITAPTVDLNATTKFNIDTVAYDLNASGAVTIDSSGGTIGIGTDAVAQAINVGTGAAARVITMGNVTGVTQVVLNAGTAGISLASTGAGDITMDSDDTLLLDADGVLELNSSAGAISIGNDNVDATINIATAGTRALNIGINDGTDLTTIAVSGPVTIDRNTAGVSAENGKGLYVDFDRTVAGSGTAAHNDIGIDVDVNSRSLGTSSVIGIDIDVVGHGDGTSTATGLTVDVGSADTNYAALFNGGNVGIGVSDPAALLEIKTSTINIGGVIANNSNDDSIHLFNYQRTNAGTIFGLTRHGAMGIYGAPNAKMLIGTVTGMPLIFATNDLERMRIVSGGSVGIGTTAPVSKFELHADEGVNATISASHDTATERPLIDFLKSRDTKAGSAGDKKVLTGDHLGAVRFYGHDGSGTEDYILGSEIRGVVNGTTGADAMPAGIEFYTNTGDASIVLRMTIQEDGDIDPGADGVYDLGSGSLQFEGLWLADGAVNLGSDERIKENIEASVLGLDFVNRLRPVSYKLKDREVEYKTTNGEGGESTITETKTYKRTHYGLIAQEVKGVLDDLSINTEKFGGYVDANFDGTADKLFLRYSEFIAPMMKAIQELSAKVTALENA